MSRQFYGPQHFPISAFFCGHKLLCIGKHPLSACDPPKCYLPLPIFTNLANSLLIGDVAAAPACCNVGTDCMHCALLKQCRLQPKGLSPGCMHSGTSITIIFYLRSVPVVNKLLLILRCVKTSTSAPGVPYCRARSADC